MQCVRRSGNVASNKIIRGSRAGVGGESRGFGEEELDRADSAERADFPRQARRELEAVNRVGTEGEVWTVDSDQGERVRPIGLGRIEWMGSLHLPELWVDLGSVS